jgi:hypothetical protein
MNSILITQIHLCSTDIRPVIISLRISNKFRIRLLIVYRVKIMAGNQDQLSIRKSWNNLIYLKRKKLRQFDLWNKMRQRAKK